MEGVVCSRTLCWLLHPPPPVGLVHPPPTVGLVHPPLVGHVYGQVVATYFAPWYSPSSMALLMFVISSSSSSRSICWLLGVGIVTGIKFTFLLSSLWVCLRLWFSWYFWLRLLFSLSRWWHTGDLADSLMTSQTRVMTTSGPSSAINTMSRDVPTRDMLNGRSFSDSRGCSGENQGPGQADRADDWLKSPWYWRPEVATRWSCCPWLSSVSFRFSV